MTENTQNDSRDLEPEEQDDAIIGVAFQWSLAVIVVLAIVAGAAFYFLRPTETEPEIVKTKLAKVEVREAPTLELPNIPFADITEAAGIRFQHENGAYGKKFLPETMGGGCAFLDFDSDGDQDLLLVNSQRWSWDPRGPAETADLLALYENDGTGHFQDVTAGSGLDVSLYGMGAAVADYDGDGRPDIFVSAVGANRLFHNEGNGKFIDVTESAGIGGAPLEWSTSCGWFDFDRDGDLDLFVCNYVKWTREFDEVQNFQLTGGGEAYGRPQNFEGTFPYLYRNDGNGKFTEVGEQAGLHIRNPATDVALAKSLGTTFADFDGDGWLDIIVANDTVQNLMFRNLQNGQFEEMGAIAGVAFDMNGAARGAMGIDAARFRNNDAVGIAIGNFSNEMTALYVSTGGQMQFMDESVSTGLGPNTRLELTFGVLYVDCDLDGRLDLFCSNGHLEEDINRVQSSQHYEQPQQLFWNCGPQSDTEFMPVPEEKCGPDLLKPMVGRGTACADIDNDGDQDLIVTAVGSRPRLLRNDQKLGNHWLKYKLVGKGANRDAIGAVIEVKLLDRTLRRSVMPTRSYLSQSELPVVFGLGENAAVETVSVTWPDGATQNLNNLEFDRLIIVEQPEE